MYRKLRDIPEYSGGNINGVDIPVDIKVRLNTQAPYKAKIEKFLKGEDDYEKVDTVQFGKEYHVHKITSYGDPFEVWITNDKGEEEDFCEWFFEDVD